MLRMPRTGTTRISPAKIRGMNRVVTETTIQKANRHSSLSGSRAKVRKDAGPLRFRKALPTTTSATIGVATRVSPPVTPVGMAAQAPKGIVAKNR